MTAADRRLLSLILLCAGVLLNFGLVSGPALVCMLGSVALATHSLLRPTVGAPLPRIARTLIIALLALTMLLYVGRLSAPLTLFAVAAAVGAIVVVRTTASPAARLAACATAVTTQLAALLANLTWGSANIDVFDFQQKASRALLNGHNPYGPLTSSPEVVTQGAYSWLPLHLPYGPILPIIEAPVRLLGDVRMLHIVAALLGTAVVLVLARRAGTLDVSLPMVIAFPLMLGMIIDSWVDIITMAGFATWLVFYRSHPKLATVGLTLALGVKPTTLIALVPIFFWSVRARRQVIVATILVVFVVMPFAIATGFSQFYYNVLGVQLSVLPRLDSLTVNSYLHVLGIPTIPAIAAAIVVGGTTVLILRQRPATYGQLLTGSAILVTVSFLLAKWAYFNYYYIAAVLFMMAIAGDALELDTPEMIRPPAVLLAVATLVRHRGRWARGRHIVEPAS